MKFVSPTTAKAHKPDECKQLADDSQTSRHRAFGVRTLVADSATKGDSTQLTLAGHLKCTARCCINFTELLHLVYNNYCTLPCRSPVVLPSCTLLGCLELSFGLLGENKSEFIIGHKAELRYGRCRYFGAATLPTTSQSLLHWMEETNVSKKNYHNYRLQVLPD